MNDTPSLASVLRHIRAMNLLSDHDALAIVQCMASKFSASEDEGTPAALTDAALAIEAYIADHANDDQTPDETWRLRQDEALESV